MESAPDDGVDGLDRLAIRPAWHARAACRGQVDTMFPGRGVSIDAARALCDACPVFDDCEADIDEAAKIIGTALAGIWAGTSARDRRRRLRRHPSAA